MKLIFSRERSQTEIHVHYQHPEYKFPFLKGYNAIKSNLILDS